MDTKILTYGDKCLFQPTTPIISVNKLIHKDIQNAISVLQKTPNALALAANQIGSTHNFFVYNQFSNNTVVTCLNPEIIDVDNKSLKFFLEGCLSFPKGQTLVGRYNQVRVRYVRFHDLTTVEETVTGIDAQMFQHEIDHLKGMLFIDRLTDKAKTKFLHKYNYTVLK